MKNLGSFYPEKIIFSNEKGHLNCDIFFQIEYAYITDTSEAFSPINVCMVHQWISANLCEIHFCLVSSKKKIKNKQNKKKN